MNSKNEMLNDHDPNSCFDLQREYDPKINSISTNAESDEAHIDRILSKYLDSNDKKDKHLKSRLKEIEKNINMTMSTMNVSQNSQSRSKYNLPMSTQRFISHLDQSENYTNYTKSKTKTGNLTDRYPYNKKDR